MNTLISQFKSFLSLTKLDFKRYLYYEVAWNSRMVGIVGSRGVGKTTMLCPPPAAVFQGLSAKGLLSFWNRQSFVSKPAESSCYSNIGN
jgi:hypothetical protein